MKELTLTQVPTLKATAGASDTKAPLKKPYTPSKKVKKGVISKTATRKEYKENYTDMNVAAAHAFALAKKANKPMLVISGNSFGHAILQIMPADNHADAIKTVNVILQRGFHYVEVEPNGTVWELTV